MTGDRERHDEEEIPRGAILLSGLLLLGIAAVFVWMYLTLLWQG